MQVVTATAAIIAVLVFAATMLPEIDHTPMQPAVTSVADTLMSDDGHAVLTPTTQCHSGHSGMPAIEPDTQVVLTRFDSAPKFHFKSRYQPSGAAYPLFQPPRVLSQV